MHDEYVAECDDDGHVRGNGYGHLDYAPAELIVEAVRDIELIATTSSERTEERCQPADQERLCEAAVTLADAAEIGCLEKVRQILNKSGLDSKDGRASPALGVAIQNGHDSVAELLLENGAPASPVTKDEWSPFHLAASHHRVGILRRLIKAGIDVEAKDEKGRTWLAVYGFFDTGVARELLKAGANPNSRDDRGATALMRAASYGYEDMVKLLLEYGADTTLKDDRGRTALMYAADGKYVDAIPQLLADGAELDARDNAGQTALDLAKSANNRYAVEILASASQGVRR